MCIQYKNILLKCQSPEQTRKYILHKLVSCIRTSYNKRTLIFNEKKTFPPVTMEKKGSTVRHLPEYWKYELFEMTL